MERNDDNWLLRVRNLTKIYGKQMKIHWHLQAQCLIQTFAPKLIA